MAFEPSSLGSLFGRLPTRPRAWVCLNKLTGMLFFLLGLFSLGPWRVEFFNGLLRWKVGGLLTPEAGLEDITFCSDENKMTVNTMSAVLQDC